MAENGKYSALCKEGDAGHLFKDYKNIKKSKTKLHT